MYIPQYLYLRSLLPCVVTDAGAGGARERVGLTSPQDSEVFNERNHISHVSLILHMLNSEHLPVIKDPSKNVSVE